MDQSQVVDQDAAELPVVARAIDAAGGPAVLARRLGVTTQAVCFWRDGHRAVPEKHGAEIESACNRAYTRKDLWPDTWQRIWPELVKGDATAVESEGARHEAA
ncbi:YdaS family helix-turn-helix protein [uncultured Variovorax sp.]|uniref:transcriptional regulator n=1 Tax=uncultured Variovorax sp. TaxID=114708 RepID=UPI00260BC28E|nr:YdaS family helix-turn-helix protein [uncultured Variovorax sp.]